LKRIKNHCRIIIYRHIIIVTPVALAVILLLSLCIHGGGWVAHVSERARNRLSKDSGQVEKVSLFFSILSLHCPQTMYDAHTHIYNIICIKLCVSRVMSPTLANGRRTGMIALCARKKDTQE